MTGAGQLLASTDKTKVARAKRGENKAVLMRALWPSKKGDFFARRGVFSLDPPFNG